MTALVYARPALDLQIPAGASPVARALVAAGGTLARWETRGRTRAELRGLCPSRYGDLGLTAAEVRHEAGKPFWRA